MTTDRSGQMMNMNKKDLELYVHIPFCVKKCAYCDFLSAPAGAEEMRSYADALVREIADRGREYKNYRVCTIFLGGGTPSVLNGEDIARIFRALRENFDISKDAEITMEANPGTVTEEKAAVWRECGVSRLSIGLQSADDQELKMLGRIHTFSEFLNTWNLVRGAGFDNINIDLISAVPGQTAKSWEKTLRTTAELGPEHISAYSLIIEEGTPFYERYAKPEDGRRGGREAAEEGVVCLCGHGSADLSESLPPLPDEDEERAMYQMTASVLKEYGYHRYEISNYAREGYECRHNLGYWERKEYLGLGLGAASLIGKCRFHNTADMGKYLCVYGSENEKEETFSKSISGVTSAGKNSDRNTAAEETEVLSERDEMEEFMFLGLRKTKGISEEDFLRAFGSSIRDIYGEKLEKLEKQGLIRLSGGNIRLTERGTDISNYVFSEFLF